MDLIETGKIVNTHGIKGEVKLNPWTSDISRLLSFKTVYIDGKDYAVENARLHKETVILKLSGIDTPDLAEKLRNKTVFVDSSLFKLKKGEYFIRDLIGLDVVDADTGISYGKLTEVLQPGANDVYEVTDEKGIKRYVPAIKDCIVSTDIEKGIMIIRPLEGLFDL